MCWCKPCAWYYYLIMKPEKIVNISEIRGRKQKESQPESLGVSPSGMFTFPKAKIEITYDVALEIARGIVEEFRKIEELVDAEARYELSKNSTPGDVTPGTAPHEVTRESVEASLEKVRQFIKPSTTESLVQLIEVHKGAPNYFSRVYLFAIAEELAKRFSQDQN